MKLQSIQIIFDPRDWTLGFCWQDERLNDGTFSFDIHFFPGVYIFVVLKNRRRPGNAGLKD